MRVTYLALVVALASTAACGSKEAAKPATDTAGSMGGMPMGMAGVHMLPRMRAHLDSLGAMQPAQMLAAMTAHQDIASRMMDAMGADMRGMSMIPDAAWTALGDSVRQDLAELPGLTGAALKARMTAHIGRMQRMMGLHEGMMRR